MGKSYDLQKVGRRWKIGQGSWWSSGVRWVAAVMSASTIAPTPDEASDILILWEQQSMKWWIPENWIIKYWKHQKFFPSFREWLQKLQYSLPRLSVYNYDPTRDEGSESRKVDNSILNARRKGKIKVNWKILYFVSRRRELSLMRTNQCSSRPIWPSLRVINFKDMTVGKRLTEVTNLSRFIILWEWQCSYCRNVLVSLR